jgi:hypothetical protein
LVKACFDPAHVKAPVTSRSLLGSPMLDIALGQVQFIDSP